MTEASIHATCVAVGRRGVLITGESGAGKSGLALQLIDAAGFGTGQRNMRARLVGDDQVRISVRDGCLVACGVDELAGLLEVRNVGLVRTAHQASAVVDLVVELSRTHDPDRLPELEAMQVALCGIALPLLRLKSGDPLAPAKVRVMLSELADGRIPGA